MMKKVDSVSAKDYDKIDFNKIFDKYEQSIYGNKNIDILNSFFHNGFFELVDKKFNDDDDIAELMFITNLTFNNNTFLVGINNKDYDYHVGYIINTRNVSYDETDIAIEEITRINNTFSIIKDDIPKYNRPARTVTDFYPELIPVPYNMYRVLLPKEINGLSKGFFPNLHSYCDDELSLKILLDNIKDVDKALKNEYSDINISFGDFAIFIDDDLNANIYKKEK